MLVTKCCIITSVVDAKRKKTALMSQAQIGGLCQMFLSPTLQVSLVWNKKINMWQRKNLVPTFRCRRSVVSFLFYIPGIFVPSDPKHLVESTQHKINIPPCKSNRIPLERAEERRIRENPELRVTERRYQIISFVKYCYLLLWDIVGPLQFKVIRF